MEENEFVFKGCGVRNVSDYQNATKWNRTYFGINLNWNISDLSSGSRNMSDFFWLEESEIPITCCKVNSSTYFPRDLQCPIAPTADNANLQTRCYEAVDEKWLRPYLWVQWVLIGAVGGVLAVPALLMLALVTCFADAN